MKVLFLVNSLTDACSFYRAGGIVRDLRERRGDDIFCVEYGTIPLHWQNIMDFDLIMMQRPSSDAELSLAKYMKHLRVPLWVDHDDNLFEIPIENRAYLIYDNKRKKIVSDILQLADVVTVTTNDLKNAYDGLSGDVRVIPNALNDGIFIREGKLPKRAKNVIWRGSDSHVYDVMSFGQAINQVKGEFPEYMFTFMGYKPWYLEQTPNMKAVPEIDLIMYMNFLTKQKPIVMQVPLDDNFFNHCKSNIAFLEGTFAGAACLVPDWWDVPGGIHYKGNQGYYLALKAMLNKEVDIVKQNEQAWEYVQDTLLLSKVNDARLSILDMFRK
jgi:hypothetical protein